MARGRQRTAGEKTGHRKPPGEIEPLSANLVPVSDDVALREPPADLPPAAAGAWRVCIAEMSANRHVREADLVSLRAYVQWVQIREDAWEDYLQYGNKVKIDGKTKRNPALITMKEADTQARYWADILGLSPLARVRQNLAELAGQNMVMDLRDRLMSDLGGA